MAYLKIAGALITFLAVAAVGMKGLAALGLSLKGGPKAKPSTSQAIAALAINVAILSLIVAEEFLFAGSLASLRLRFTPYDLVVGAGGAAVTLAAAWLFARLHGSRARRPPAGPAICFLTLTVLFFGAMMEEVLFRAFIIPRLQIHGAAVALVVSTLLFTLIHLPTSRVTSRAIAAWTLGGLAFGGAWLAGAPLIVVTLLHFSRNVGNVLWVDPHPEFGLVTSPSASDASRVAYYAIISAAAVALTVLAASA